MGGVSSNEMLITERWSNQLNLWLAEAKSQGDTERERALEERLSKVVVVSPQELLTSRVQFGCNVTVFSLGEEEEQTFEIVSSDEACVSKGLLDHTSPLAVALLGAREGDVVTVVASPTSRAEYEVTHIRLPHY